MKVGKMNLLGDDVRTLGNCLKKYALYSDKLHKSRVRSVAVRVLRKEAKSAACILTAHQGAFGLELPCLSEGQGLNQ